MVSFGIGVGTRSLVGFKGKPIGEPEAILGGPNLKQTQVGTEPVRSGSRDCARPTCGASTQSPWWSTQRSGGQIHGEVLEMRR